LIAVAGEHDFPLWGAQGRIYRGWARVKSGDAENGIALLRSGVKTYQDTGARAWTPYYLALLARTCAIAGNIDESWTVLDNAWYIVEKTGERWFAAELHRHQGDLLLQRGDSPAAAELYGKALSIAEEQGARLWQLRAAARLARLRRDQGRRGEARDLLAGVYDWFAESFDTPDLKEARLLLDALE
jgi:predicted ATPase